MFKTKIIKGRYAGGTYANLIAHRASVETGVHHKAVSAGAIITKSGKKRYGEYDVIEEREHKTVDKKILGRILKR